MRRPHRARLSDWFGYIAANHPDVRHRKVYLDDAQKRILNLQVHGGLRCTKDLGQRLLSGEDLSLPEQRRKFSPQVKPEAVQMVLETRKLIAEVARRCQAD